MAEGSSPKQSLMSRDVTDDSQKEMRNHRAKVRELMSAGESFIATLNESTGYENVALIFLVVVCFYSHPKETIDNN